ncbi:hypothetical protein [Chitinophaga sp.]|uniref:hypothetical protein n=1 Tax=Chitinophaga sp. TaxID=1869181 RepID=UPI0031E06ADA
MKRRPLALALLSVTVLGAAMMSSCKKDATTSAPRSVSAPGVIPSNPTLSGVLGTGHTVKDTIHLVASTAWHLSGLVYVDSSDVLIIDAGTKIYGNLSSSSSVPGGGLVITRGAKILAEGTESSPIVFTSAATTPASGDWSGVVILGNASTNHTGRVQVEGIPTNPPADATFGGSTGTNDADNSGILKYVRIEYGGYELSTDNEINGLTLAGVGSGTTIDYVEVFKSKDDSFEWFGGTVNASHLLSIDGLDDMFDTDNGYRGTISYALGVSDTTRADKSQSNGFESDNNATGTSATPLTNPVYNYVTIVGVSNVWTSLKTNGAPSGTGKYGRAAHLRRNARYTINNSIFLGFYYGVSRDTQFGNAQGTFTNTYAEAFSYPFLTEVNGTSQAAVTPAGTQGSSVTNFANGYINLADPFDRSSISNFETTFASPDGGTAGAFANGNWASSGTWVRLR